MEFVLRLQVRRKQCEDYNLRFPRRGFGGFRHDLSGEEQAEMRNDYTQHTLSAMVRTLSYASSSFLNGIYIPASI
jgi:hypothetical protein